MAPSFKRKSYFEAIYTHTDHHTDCISRQFRIISSRIINITCNYLHLKKMLVNVLSHVLLRKPNQKVVYGTLRGQTRNQIGRR